MTATTQTNQADESAESVEFEGEIREFIRKDVAPWRKQSESVAETPAENINFLVQRVAGASLREIDAVIDELRNVRDFLRNEGDRVQREIATYANLSQAAMASMKIIADSMSQWRATVGSSSSFRE
jgi:hypothetical protein